MHLSPNPSLRYLSTLNFKDPVSYQDLGFGVRDIPKLRILASLERCCFQT